MTYLDEWQYTTGKIKETIKNKGWSLSRLGDEINMDKANLSRILSNEKTNMQYVTLFKIADALGVKMSELVR